MPGETTMALHAATMIDRLRRATAYAIGAMLLAGCATVGPSIIAPPPTVPRNAEPPTPKINLSGFPLPYRQGYADGCATRWSAERLLPDEFASSRELFTGEMVYSWMFEDYGLLAPWREIAHVLAEREWPRLYDAERLSANDVPAAAAIYTDDLYVERKFSEETAAHIRGLRAWVTNEYQHNGLRADGGRILGRLIDLARGRA